MILELRLATRLNSRADAIQTDVRSSRLSRLPKVGGPVRVPLTGCAVDAQRRHVIGTCREPPGARTFQAVLCNASVAAFNIASANRQVTLLRSMVVKLLVPLVQVPVRLSHWRFIVGKIGWLKMQIQSCDQFVAPPQDAGRYLVAVSRSTKCRLGKASRKPDPSAGSPCSAVHCAATDAMRTLPPTST